MPIRAPAIDVVLTLAGETNLGDVIEVGDTVTANVSYTPETSQIDSVSVPSLQALLRVELLIFLLYLLVKHL